MISRYFIKISFDGTRYNGWQAQKNSANTVQQKINEGLSKLLNEKIEVHGCCRTDTGVHAKELYAHFDSEKKLSSPSPRKGDLELTPKNPPPSVESRLFRRSSPLAGLEEDSDWLHKFNSILPFDISIDGIYPVDENANARYDATARTYQYFIHRKRNPFLVNRSYYYYGELDIALMNKAAKLLMACEDFSSFSKVHTQVKTNRCKIYEAEWKTTTLTPFSLRRREGDEVLVFTIRADRFLRGMVRMIVGTMFLLGKNKITLGDFKKIIESKDCRNAGALAPACGLYLTKIEYPKSIFK